MARINADEIDTTDREIQELCEQLFELKFTDNLKQLLVEILKKLKA